MRLSAEKGRLDRSLNTAEQELQEAQQQILMQQVGRRSHHADTFTRGCCHTQHSVEATRLSTQ